MKNNYQRGTIGEASGCFFVRYFAGIDGVKQRVSHKLCDRDEEHYTTTAPFGARSCVMSTWSQPAERTGARMPYKRLANFPVVFQKEVWQSFCWKPK
jgi:hypothetical protein